MIFLFLLVCTATIFVVLKAPFFNVKTIICVGRSELSEAEVIKIAGAKTNVNIFSTGVGTMKRRLAAHPSIAECNVRRLFPNKIKIWIREAKAVICAEKDGVLLLAEKHGQIIKTINTKTEETGKNIAQLKNFEPASVKIGEYIFNKENAVHNVAYDCIGLLDSLGIIEQVTEIDVSDLSDIKLEYQDRLSLWIGSYEQMEYKLNFAKKVIDENISKYEKAILDYRGSKLYVGPANTEETAQAEQKTDAQAENTEDKETKSEQTITENQEG